MFAETPPDILNELRERGVEFRVENDRLRFFPKSLLTDAEVNTLRLNKHSLICLLLATDVSTTPSGALFRLLLCGGVLIRCGRHVSAGLPDGLDPQERINIVAGVITHTEGIVNGFAAGATRY